MISENILKALENVKGKIDTAWSAHRAEECSLLDQMIYVNGIIHDLSKIVNSLKDIQMEAEQ